MYLAPEKKAELFKNHGRLKSDKDTGSPESQIALFTYRIKHLPFENQQKRSLFEVRSFKVSR